MTDLIMNTKINLWQENTPYAQGNTAEDIPFIEVYPADKDKATGAAMIICPGGGYSFLSLEREGDEPAKWFNALGVTAFVLNYRLGPTYHHPVQLSDVQRTIRLVRTNSAEWNVNPDKIGVMGYSAGGHLAATAAVYFDAGDKDNADPVERASSRPNFAVLAYPVITLKDPYTHAGSRLYLLGENPSEELVNLLSTEDHVSSDTPPVFIFHTDEDTAVPPENSALFYLALKKHGVPAEMHIYMKGPHGTAMGKGYSDLCSWPDRLVDWMRNLDIV